MQLDKALRIWDVVEKYLVGVLATVALAIAFYQVVMRYVFNNAPEWAEETVLYLVIWSVFIMASKLVRDNEHIGADFIYNRLPMRARRIVTITTVTLCLAFCILVVYYGLQIVDVTYLMDERSTTRLRFPMWIAYLAVPSGTALITLSYLYRLYVLTLRFSPEQLEGHEEEKLKGKS